MATHEQPALPSGVLTPLTVNSHEDRGGLIIIVSALSLGVTLVLLAIRAYIQQIRRTIRLDDILLFAATILFCLQTSSVFVQVHHGWGKMSELLQMQDHTAMLKSAYITDILYIFTLYISKCSGAFFYLRISPGRILYLAVWSIFSIVTTWMVISVLVLGLRCDISHPWTDITAQCDKIFVRWQVVCIADMITELAIACLSIILVHNIQINNRRKFQVILALSSRIIVFAPAGLHIFYLHRQLNSPSPTYYATYATICAQIQVGYILVANTIPCLKPFIAAYEGFDAKLTFRGQSASPGESGLPSHDEENNQEHRRKRDSKDSTTSDISRQECPSEKPVNLQQRRRGEGQSLMPLHMSGPGTGIGLHGDISIQKAELVTFAPYYPSTRDEVGVGIGTQLSPVTEHPESERWSYVSNNTSRIGIATTK